ncbi:MULTISPECIES: zf-HC2 domain-containing protein [Paenibacillus]|uniref:Anti-sigma-W factor RsiW n=1 Tax=Paenibacillus barengoltzii J12 TaxID=935846 RepID=A0ABY1LZP2_9BACL|nr:MULTISPECIES: zf-HC2 domain-containing protein [Paenibacillus]MEC2343868.1 zf-HC2 domain-containing protein [Paenibacillus barengoltzii]SMF12197.1 mycothiol system anti-sigma-R factor [Paenibacillus barengoltzii]SMF41983.1 mycothiol system anti-sigma-R factor [Paenibacillus barengoltzii J12]
MECKHASSMMHDYLDGELSRDQAERLKQHLDECPDCLKEFRELERTEMMLFATIKQHSNISAPDELVNRIISQIPSQPKQQAWIKWIKRHPALTAAAMFLLVMLFSAVSIWDSDDQLVVKGAGLDQVIIQGDTVTVPSDAVIAGNLTIENGKAEIYGEVQGNLTVIDGSYYQASTAHISGEVKQIDQALDWIWYRIINTFTEVAYR